MSQEAVERIGKMSKQSGQSAGRRRRGVVAAQRRSRTEERETRHNTSTTIKQVIIPGPGPSLQPLCLHSMNSVVD